MARCARVLAAGQELPPALDRDPADLTAAERARLGIRPLPGSLAEAIALMEADATVAGFLPKVMRESWIAVKRKEIEMTEGLDDDTVCARYREAY